ncbi:MAG: GspMb/PilO family protein [Vicinamibacteria bacterium]
MNRRASRTRLRIALLGVFLLAMNAVAFVAFTWPRLTRARRAESRALEVSARRAALERLWSQVQARKELLARNRADIESLARDHLKFRAEDLFATQREIEKLAREAGLKPKKSSYSIAKIKGADLVRCEVTLPLDGTYASLTGFLARIQSAKRFIVVDQMALAQNEAGAQMNLKLSAIFKEGEPRATN